MKVPLLLDSGAAIGDAILINEPHHAAFRKLAANAETSVYTATSIRVAGTAIDSNVRCLLRPFERSVLGTEFFHRHVISVDIGAVQTLPEGVYLAINGRVLDPARVQKNHERHCFEDIPSP